MFGRRTKRPLPWSRRDRDTETRPTPNDPGSEDLPSASASTADAEGFPATDIGSEPTSWGDKPVTSDPTQRLLTALGRFQRQFLKAKEGAPQEQWSDECMNHLIQGVEIALEQDWADIVEALGETGRILQTYEDVGRANQCVPFLADSYETLCLMVGDLIVGKTRSGAIVKWRERYEMAVEDATAAGLSLVEDEDGESPPRRSPEARKATQPPVLTVVPPPQEQPQNAEPARGIWSAEQKFGVPRGAEQEFSGVSTPPPPAPARGFGLTPLGELPPLKPVVVPEARIAPPPLPEQTVDDRGTLFEEIPSGDSEADLVDIPELPEMGEEPLLDLASFATATDQETPNDVDPEPEEQGRRLSVDVVELLDTLCDGLARIENEPDGSLSTVFLAMDDGLATLQDRARQLGWHGSVLACRTMASLCEAMSKRRSVRDDKFFELAYAFGGVYGEAQSRTDDASLTTWQNECNGLIEAWSSTSEPAEALHETSISEIAEIQETASDIPTIEAEGGDAAVNDLHELESVEPASAYRPAEQPGEDDSAASLLDTARQAVAGGSIADAKFYAMRAAVSIAKKQVAETETRVRTLELRHQECARNIEVAREQVQQAEVSVADAERQAVEGTESLGERGRHAEGVQSSLDGIQSRIDDLEEKIRDLQQQLEEAERQHAATQTALEEARAQEASAATRLDELKGGEQQARVQLEDARQQVKVHQRRLTEIEAAMEKSREVLTRQRASVAEIEQTIEQVRTAETGDEARADELLF
ncbi:MAG: hypothetical protein WC655_01925 [Candidatus Hydrogenedentales bacterium]|jgi:predicted  nucleic acid-binding Zn-ribbon protein